ncbi:hypothetical protein C8R47DRAFT_1222269 [Mycena vitilis]|nr:hypothetical protein C8R47DRAFT_1222269 [Mycena vitilis]
MDDGLAHALAPVQLTPPPGNHIDDILDELLDEILLELIGEPVNFSAYTLARRYAISVSRRWRDRVYNNSAFWKTVWIHRFTPDDFLSFTVRMAKRAPTFDLLLDAIPSSVVVSRPSRFTPVVCKSIPVYGRMVVRLVGKSFSKVQRLGVMASTPEDWVHVMSVLTRFNAPNLHCVEACKTGLQTRPWVQQPTPAWQGIRRLTLDGLIPTWFGSSIALGLSELALGRLRGGSKINASELLGILRGTPQLTLLKMQDVDCTPALSADKLTMHRLTHFCFTYSVDRYVDILQHIHTPAIRYLRLDAYLNARLGAILPIATGIVAGALDLQIFSEQPAPQAVASCLLAATRTETLDLSDLGDGVMSSLSQALAHDRNVLPCLRRLTIAGNFPESSALELFTALHRHDRLALIVVGDKRNFREWRAQDGKVQLSRLGVWRNKMEMLWEQLPIRRVPTDLDA